ncbi:endolytic transglycosylase MltG [Bacillus sp. EB600]|uniref:endolytic transglycosylase MltG n=1 Tax=Bacillus sp. EB600 TaxID=2806345 RepID=UPI00210A9B6C|nr:endolytic transglycosylase MltG [Bacillus sp. EB600]MCQ6278197.1 endolytic transglycosylase MltG [Bacillus sp. EB600]
MSEDDKKTKKIIQPKVLEDDKEAGAVRRIVLFVSFSIILLAAIIAGGGYVYIKTALNPVSPNSKEQKIIEIPAGTTITGIASILESKGIVKDARVFTYYVKLKNESAFMAGSYELSPSMSVSTIINHLKAGRVNPVVTITIPEGTQLKEIAQIIAKAINKPESDVFNQLNDKTYVSTLVAKYPEVLTNDIFNSKIMYPLEGYLFPATYPFYKSNLTVDEIVTVMLDKTNKVLAAYRDQIKQKQLTTHQLITMASLIEEEASVKADRNKISSVFYNRLQKGMPLQTDPTVLYAQGKHKERVLYQDLEVNSPYNTYKNVGLPPGPISNAGKVSIEAALYPAQTDYYYFLATADGSVIFSKTLAEHNREKAKYISSEK